MDDETERGDAAVWRKGDKQKEREKEKERERNLVRASEHERWFCVECDERYSNARRGRGCESEKDGAPRGTFHVRLRACVETTPHYHTLKMDWLERKTTRERARRVRTRRKN